MRLFHKDRMINISVNRDSVCLGDDCEDHQKKIKVKENISVSEFLFMLSDYVPHMKNVIWSIHTNKGIRGYIITDDTAKASVELCGKDTSLIKSGIFEAMCSYFYPSKFFYIDDNSGDRIEKYPECTTFFEKVKKAEETVDNGYYSV